RARRARPPCRGSVDDRAAGTAAWRGRGGGGGGGAGGGGAVTPPGAPRQLRIATRNEGKIREIRDLFQELPFQLAFPVDQFLERLPDERDLERGTSFAENAVAKARYFAKRGNVTTLAEDSGLEVDALEGAPRVFSARWAEMHGAGAGDAANNALLLARLAD